MGEPRSMKQDGMRLEDRRFVRLPPVLTIVVLAATGALAYSSARAAETRSAIRFRDAQPSAGLTFRLENSPTSRKHLPETMAGGVAAFDYDGDGLTDLF